MEQGLAVQGSAQKKHVADSLAQKAAIMKESRKAKEELNEDEYNMG